MVALLGLSLSGFVLWGMSKIYERSIEKGRRVRYDEKWSGSEEERGGGSSQGASGKATPTP